MEEVNGILSIIKKNRQGKENLKDVKASGLAKMDTYVKAVGEYKAYLIIEQEIQDLQKDEDNNDGTSKGNT